MKIEGTVEARGIKIVGTSKKEQNMLDSFHVYRESPRTLSPPHKTGMRMFVSQILPQNTALN